MVNMMEVAVEKGVMKKPMYPVSEELVVDKVKYQVKRECVGDIP